jgi:hypothetical protein
MRGRRDRKKDRPNRDKRIERHKTSAQRDKVGMDKEKREIRYR